MSLKSVIKQTQQANKQASEQATSNMTERNEQQRNIGSDAVVAASEERDSGLRSSSVPHVPFNGTASAYPGWKRMIEAVFDEHDLMDVVEKPLPEKTFARSVIDDDVEEAKQAGASAAEAIDAATLAKLVKKSKRAYTILLINLKSEELHAVVCDVPRGNAHELWTRLNEHYGRNTIANKHALLSQFQSLRQESGESVAKFSARVKKCIIDLRGVEEHVSPSRQQFAFLNGLTSSYSTLKTLVPMMPPSNLEAIINLALQLETTMALESKQGANPQHRGEQAHTATSSSSSGSTHNTSTNSSFKGKCHTCGAVGHSKKYCPKAPGGPHSPCAFCGRLGHDEPECHQKNPSLRKNGNGSHNNNNNNSNSSKQAQGQRKGASAMSATDQDDHSAFALAAHSFAAKGYLDVKGGRIIMDTTDPRGYHYVPASSPSAPGTKGSSSGEHALSAEMCATSLETKINSDLPSGRFLIDSGASKHYATSAIPLGNATIKDDVTIKVAAGASLTAPSVGQVRLKTSDGVALSLSGVHSHPQLSANLLSVHQLCGQDGSVVFTAKGVRVLDARGEIVLQAPSEGGVYPIHAEAVANSALTVYMENQQQQKLWHARLLHPADCSLQKVLAAEAVIGMEKLKKVSDGAGQCGPCIEGKSHRAKFGDRQSERTKATAPLDRLHADLLGPFRQPSLGGAHYILVMVDEFSRKTFLRCLTHKSEAETAIVNWCLANRPQGGGMLKAFHSDGGGEFVSNSLATFFRNHGITATKTTSGTAQHNGKAERKIRFLGEKMVAAMQAAGAPAALWAECAQAVAYVTNLSTLRTGTTETPEALFTSHAVKPSVAYLRVWGCDCWVHIPGTERSTLDPKGQLGIFIGYDEPRLFTAYRILIVSTRKIIISRDVTFEETKFTQCAALTAVENGESLEDFSDFMDSITFDNETRIMQIISLQYQNDEQNRLALQGQAPAPVPIPVAASAPPAAFPAGSPPAPGNIASSPAIALSPAAAPAVGVHARFEPRVDPSPTIAAPLPPARPLLSVSAVKGRTNRKPTEKSLSSYAAELEQDITVEEIGEYAMALDATEYARDPRSFTEAMESDESEEWTTAVKLELRAMEVHQVWKLIPIPPGARAIGCKWVFTRKRNKHGKVVRWKARLVAKGFAQREGVDFFETFAPVLHYKSLRVLCSLVASLDLEFLQMDVPTAFLNAECKEDVYMKLPEGFKLPNGIVHGGLVLKLLKTLYGIRQAPREWNSDFNGSIVELGYKRCLSDTCVYVKMSRSGNVIIITVFVDDVFAACARIDLEEMRADLGALMRKYSIKDLNDADVILGMRVTRDRTARTLKLDQTIYINKLLQQYNMTSCKPALTPEAERPFTPAHSATSTSSRAHHDSDDTSSNSSVQELGRYGSIVGALLYIALSTRPDIAHAASVLSRAISNPTAAHLIAAKRVLRYLSATSDLGLVYHSPQQHRTTVTLAPTFCDADWAGDLAERRSTSGIVLKVNGNCVVWSSKRQSVVSTSSAEAEYMAAGAATQEILWLRALLGEMTFVQSDATVLYCDNQAAIAIASDDVHHTRTKHIDIRHHFIRSHIASGVLSLKWISSTEQQADILTKALGHVLFTRIRAALLNCTF